MATEKLKAKSLGVVIRTTLNNDDFSANRIQLAHANHFGGDAVIVDGVRVDDIGRKKTTKKR